MTAVAEIAFRFAPLSVESSTDTLAAYEFPLPRPLIVMSSFGEPPMSRWLSVIWCPEAATPYIDWPSGTTIRRLEIATRTGAGLDRLDRLMKKTALEAIGSPSMDRSRTGPRPSETMQAPSEVIVVSSCETQRPRVA
jgi:hypothetical protein